MKSSTIERSAVAKAAGPQITREEIETLAWLNRQREIDKTINEKTREERQEISTSAMMLIVQPAAKEAQRAAFWNASRVAARRVAVMAGGMAKESAAKPLASFDAFQRGRINIEIEKLITDLRIIQKCMNGGHVQGTEAAH